MRARPLLGLLLLAASPAFAVGRSTDSVDWKLLFNQLFALEMHKESLSQAGGEAGFQSNLAKYTAYTAATFSQAIATVLQANSSREAYTKRDEVFSDPKNQKLIAQLDFSRSVPASVQGIPAVSSYLRAIETNGSRVIGADENFFSTPEAKNVADALAYASGGPKGQKVALVLVPGYAAHVIKFGIFPEIVGDMNRFYGRESARPILNDKNGIDFTYEDYRTFYSKTKPADLPFDILTPVGWELGNTVGLNAETADLMAKWLGNLPAAYANHKFFLLGYSKGAPIILEMLKRHPELKSRVLGVVTFAGVVQGTHVGRSGGQQIREYLGKRTVAEMVDTIRARGAQNSIDALAPFAASFNLGITKIPVLRDMMDVAGVDSSLIEAQINRLLSGRELRELLDGVDDLSPLVRSRWNLLNFDNDLVAPGTAIFNLSGITDISAFAARLAGSNVRQRPGALLTPRTGDDGKIDWKTLSLDAWFLYLSSMSGFKMAPGGLYDTQVDLQHTKSPWLDETPLSASLTASEMATLWSQQPIRDKLRAGGVTSLEQFTATPRTQLFKPESWQNIRAYDLGEFKGHHWSLFHQAFRAPPEVSADYYVWEFPRKAFMRALLQTLALYNVINQNS